MIGTQNDGKCAYSLCNVIVYRYLCCDAESLSVTVSLSVSSRSILGDSSVTSDRSRLDTWHRLLVVFLMRDNHYANIKNERIIRDMFIVTVHIFGLSWGLGDEQCIPKKPNKFPVLHNNNISFSRHLLIWYNWCSIYSTGPMPQPSSIYQWCISVIFAVITIYRASGRKSLPLPWSVWYEPTHIFHPNPCCLDVISGCPRWQRLWFSH